MVDYAQNRKAFGKPLHEFGQVQRYIGDSYALMEAAKALTYNTARSIAPGNRNRIGSDAVKVLRLAIVIYCCQTDILSAGGINGW